MRCPRIAAAPSPDLPWDGRWRAPGELHQSVVHAGIGRMKMLIADVVLAGAFGVGGVGNSVSSQFMASFRQRSGLLQLERSDAMRCDACSAQGNAAACGVKSKHSGHRLFLLMACYSLAWPACRPCGLAPARRRCRSCCHSCCWGQR